MFRDYTKVSTDEEYRTLVLGRDVTATIDPKDYVRGIPEDCERRRKKYQRAHELAQRPGATVDIMPSGSVIIRYWDKFFNAVTTTTAPDMDTNNYDFDVMIAGWLAGGANIYDHRLP